MAQGKQKAKGSALKRFFGNKNTVTALGFLACILILIVGYNVRVSKAISPISIPYAKESIPSKTLITGDMIGKIKVASSYVTTATNLVKYEKEVVGKHVSYKTNIPKGSLFYADSLKDAEEMPDNAFANIDNNQTIYSLAVDKDKTFANSIRAGDYIDIYMSANYNQGTETLAIYGCLIKSIRVLAVKDDNGENILKNTLVYGEPAELLFAVDDDMFKLLMESQWIGQNVELHPVIFNKDYTNSPSETEVDSDDLVEFIKSYTAEFDQ